MTAAPSRRSPLVSIGVPVYNAERYLRQALDSLVGQDYANLEVIISDNASEDSTERICREYAQRDSRVLYQRLDRNMGAVWNFDRVFELAHGEYFMWAAFDDIRAPTCVSACVAALESQPDAALCATDIVFMDENGGKVEAPSSLESVHPTGRTARDRLRRVAQAHVGYDFYGLARRSVLAQTRRSVLTWGFDVIVLLELCLRGPVLVVAEPLFSYRLFLSKTQKDLAVGLSGSEPHESVPVCWSCLTVELLRSIWLTPVGRIEKVQLTGEFLLRFCLLNLAMGAGIRRDLAVTIRRAWSARAWGRLAVLLGIGLLVYPVHNPVSRSLYRGWRRVVYLLRRPRRERLPA